MKTVKTELQLQLQNQNHEKSLVLTGILICTIRIN